MKALIFSILSGLGFGGSMFLRKLSVKEVGLSAFILETVTEVLLAFLLVSILFPFDISRIFSKLSGVIFGILGGISIGIGVISFFLAVKYGSVVLPSFIAPIIGAITASLLSIFILSESLSIVKVFGMMLALIGLFIFTALK